MGGPPVGGFGEELITMNREKPTCFDILHKSWGFQTFFGATSSVSGKA